MSKTNLNNAAPLFPRLAVGAVVIKDSKILLAQRKHPPHQNEWAIPGGKIKWGESLQQAAERELFEETGIRVEAHQSIYTFELIKRNDQQHVTHHYVIVDFICHYLSGEIQARSDANAVRWFDQTTLSTEHINSDTLHLLRDIIHFFDA